MTARVAVEQLEGVEEAVFSYERSEGFVLYDSTVATVDEVIDGLLRTTGYVATVRISEGTER